MGANMPGAHVGQGVVIAGSSQDQTLPLKKTGTTSAKPGNLNVKVTSCSGCGFVCDIVCLCV